MNIESGLSEWYPHTCSVHTLNIYQQQCSDNDVKKLNSNKTPELQPISNLALTHGDSMCGDFWTAEKLVMLVSHDFLILADTWTHSAFLSRSTCPLRWTLRGSLTLSQLRLRHITTHPVPQGLIRRPFLLEESLFLTWKMGTISLF